MPTLEHNGSSFQVDEDGFLLKGMEEFNQDWIDYVKGVEGISELTDEHNKVIDALQEYYKKNGIAPMVRILSKTTGFPLKRIYECSRPDLEKEPVKWLVFLNRLVAYNTFTNRF